MNFLIEIDPYILDKSIIDKPIINIEDTTWDAIGEKKEEDMSPEEWYRFKTNNL